MSEMSVDVGLNIQADEYLSTMGQAVAITKQYAGVADGLSGRVADLNKGLVGLTERFTGFNKVNSVAVDTAAAYQKQLSGIEAKAALTGKNFEALAKTTKGFAKDFPIGMGNAVAVVESLQKSGVKAESQIASLGKSWIRLGAATGTNAAAIGADMMQLNKMMGNGISQFDALADSAVGATAKIGGSVPSVVAFSKALAPVASTVGLSQTAVIGLSTAMSSLGEDGYRAANTVSKVLLDMNRSIRDGGPDLKAYADMMGMTSDSLKALFKTDPSEVLSRFSDAIAQKGPAISKSLEALGFDSVRDTRAITALANAGGPRSAIQAAVSSYGSGSTAQAAEVAMEGVVDQADMLKESMSQVVANVGTPMLGIAKVQLQIANQVSGLMAGLTESAPGQAVLGVAGAGGVLGSMASSVMTIGALGAGYRYAKRGITGSRAYGGFADGRDAARPGGVGGDVVMGAGTRMEQLGYLAQSTMMGMGPSGGVPGLEGAPGVTGRLAKASGSMGLSGVAKWQAANANFILRELGRSPVGQTEAGQSAMSSAGAAMSSMASAVGNADREGFKQAREQLKEARSAARDMLRESAGRGIGAGIGDVARYSASGLGAAGMMAGSIGARGLAVGAGAMNAIGLTGPMLAVTGGLAAGTMISSQNSQNNDQLSRISETSKDIYGAFNSFSEAAGMAGKGLVSFSAQVENTTTTLVDQNSSMQEALTLTSAEMNQAISPGYTPAFKIAGDNKSAQSIAAQLGATLGPEARPQELSRALMDVANQAGSTSAKDVSRIMETVYKQNKGDMGYEDLLSNLQSQSNSFFKEFGNEAQGTIGSLMASKGQRSAYEASSVFGGTLPGTDVGAGDVTRIGEFKKLYDQALSLAQSPTSPMSISTLHATNKALQAMLGATDDQALSIGLGADQGPMASSKALATGMTSDEVLAALGNYNGPDGKSSIATNYQSAKAKGFDFDNIDYSKFSSNMPAPEKEARDLESAFNKITGASNKLTDSLYGAEKAARNSGTLLTGLSEGTKAGMGKSERALLDYETNPSDDKRLAAGRLLANDAVSGANGNQAMAAFRLAIQAANAPEGYKKEAVQAAVEFQRRDMALANAGQSPLALANQQAIVGRYAQQLPQSSNSQVNQAIQSQITIGSQAEGAQRDAVRSMNLAYGAMQAQIGSIRRSSGIASGAVMRDERLNEGWATEDYNLQRQYAQQDISRSRRRSNRDFGISMGRSREDFARSEQYAKEDYTKSRARATEDFTKQQTYAEADFNKSKTRANEDYETGRSRATRDFNKQIERANRDFRLGQTRADEDFNRSRTRATEDFNKQVKRMVEDSAKNMYDPFKRISAQMVMDAGQLVTNLKDQTAALNKQVGNLADARSMGLSEEAIKALSLSDASNAQQLSRLVEDMKGNSSLVDQINQQVSAKATAAGSLYTDKGNVSYSRMQEDFAISQERSSEDYATYVARSTQDFSTSMVDAQLDFTTTMGDSASDFNKQMTRSNSDYLTSVARSKEAFDVSIERMDTDYETTRARAAEAFTTQTLRAIDSHRQAMHDMTEDFVMNQDRGATAFETSIERMRIKASNAVSDIGAQAGAQITSMQEQFLAMLQNSSTDPKSAAKTLLHNLLGLGIPKEKWGDEVKAVWDAAVAQIYGSDANDASEAGFPFFTKPSSVLKSADGTPTAAHEPKAQASGTFTVPYNVSALDSAFKSLKEKITQAGADLITGFFNGVMTGNPVGMLIEQARGMLNAFKSFFGINSPSTVFAELGENIVQGLKNGITGAISGTWELITAPIANLDIAGKVTAAFGAAKTWIGNLGSHLLEWIDKGWDGLWSKVGGLDILGKVKGAFGIGGDAVSGVASWLGGLGGEISSWIGAAWNSVVDAVPDASFITNKVKAAFGVGSDAGKGIYQWLTGLGGEAKKGADNVLTWVGDAWSNIVGNVPGAEYVFNAFKSIGDGFDSVLNKLRSMVSSLRIDIPIPGFLQGRDILGQHIPESLTIGGGTYNPVVHDWKFALGGIATREVNATIGEAGYPEAVIPLNQRGADVLAETMARYVGNNDVRSANAMSNSSQVYNNYNQSYDYRTQYTGPITVQSQDPDDMAIKLASRKRRQRLAQPIGASS